MAKKKKRKEKKNRDKKAWHVIWGNYLFSLIVHEGLNGIKSFLNSHKLRSLKFLFAIP